MKHQILRINGEASKKWNAISVPRLFDNNESFPYARIFRIIGMYNKGWILPALILDQIEKTWVTTLDHTNITKTRFITTMVDQLLSI